MKIYTAAEMREHEQMQTLSIALPDFHNESFAFFDLSQYVV